jgi:RNA polymerase sigma-70 factor, ECF subfamily
MKNSTNKSNVYEEASLVKMAASGDLDAFNQLVLRHQNIAYGHAYALLGDAAQADDVAQQSFLNAFQAIHTFRGVSFRSWLLTIVTNSAYDLLRRSQRHPTQPLFPYDENDEEVESPAWLADPASDVQEIVEQRELSNQIYRALDELPEVYRTVLTLIDLSDMDYMEAAEALRIPIGTVKSRLARARLQMQKKLRNTLNQRSPTIATKPCLAV